MIKTLNYRPFIDDETCYVEMTGLSTDNKPTFSNGKTIGQNSLFLELDTKSLYYCSKSGSESEETVVDGVFTATSDEIRECNLGVINLADKITVVFDGVEYKDLPKQNGGVYGAPWNESTQSVDYSVCPFRINYNEGFGSAVLVGESGIHSFAIYSGGELIAEKTYDFATLTLLSDILPSYEVFESLSRTITVTLNGETYICTRQVDYYGADRDETGDFDFSKYPFYFAGANMEVKGKPGDYSVKIESTLKTEATWTKYGESGGISGTINVYYLKDGQEVTELASQVAQGESVTLPLYDGKKARFRAFLTSGELGEDYLSGETFTPTSECIFTEVPSDFSDATVPFVCFDVRDTER